MFAGNLYIFLGEMSFFFFKLWFYLFIYLFIHSFIYLWLCWVFVSVRGLSPVAASGGHSSSRPLLLWSTGSRRAGSVIVAHGPSRSAACGILPDQGSNPCPLHRQADSQPLCHQGSPGRNVLFRSSAHFWILCFFDIELHDLPVYFGDYSFVSCFVCKYFLPF